MVFVKYNQALKARYDKRDVIDTISLQDIDESNEWSVGKMGEVDEDVENEVFVDNNSIGLTWGDVARAAGVGETRPRRNSLNSSASSKASSSRVFLQDVGGLGADLDDTYKEDINGFQSDHGNGSDEDLFEKSNDDF